MHNSENQEAKAKHRNVSSPPAYLSIFRTIMKMILSMMLIKDYTSSRPRSIQSAADFNNAEN